MACSQSAAALQHTAARWQTQQHHVSSRAAAPATSAKTPRTQWLAGGQIRLSAKPVGLRGSSVVSSRRQSNAVVVAADLTYLTPADAKDKVEKGTVTVLDVREPGQYGRAHIVGSVHVPLFVPNDDSDFNTFVARALHNAFAGALYGLPYTKRNSAFIKTVQERFPNTEEPLLIVCQGGLVSAAAADVLKSLGYTNLSTLSGGLSQVKPGVFQKEGERELFRAGVGGFSAIQTQFSVVLGTVLVGAILFLQFFPDASTDILKNFVGGAN